MQSDAARSQLQQQLITAPEAYAAADRYRIEREAAAATAASAWLHSDDAGSNTDRGSGHDEACGNTEGAQSMQLDSGNHLPPILCQHGTHRHRIIYVRSSSSSSGTEYGAASGEVVCSTPGSGMSERLAVWGPFAATAARALLPEHSNEFACMHADDIAPPIGYALVGGMLLPSRIEQQPSGRRTGMVRTATVSRNIQAAALALCQQQPVLLQGPSGASAVHPVPCCHVGHYLFRVHQKRRQGCTRKVADRWLWQSRV